MSNFELIEEYLTDRLGEREKLEFERQLGSDPALKADVDFQKHILEGVKRARIADLKAMLNNVPVSGGYSSGIATGKIAAAVITAGIVGTSLYFILKPAETSNTGVSEISQKIEPQAASPVLKDSVKASGTAQPIRERPAKVELKQEKKTTAKAAEAVNSKPAQQPRLEVVDPSEELVDNSGKAAPVAEGQKSIVTGSHIAVETNSSDKNYTFHYQFKDGNLVLFGSFDKSLYEILEIHGDRHAVFLFYKDSYYLLDEKQSNVTPLQPIRDLALLRKLKEYRGR